MAKMFIETAMDDMHVIRVKEKMQHYEKLIKEIDDELEVLKDNDNSYKEDKETSIKKLIYRKELYQSFIEQCKSSL